MSSAAALPIEDFLKQLDELVQSAVAAFDAASEQEQLEDARIEFLGAKSGKLKSVQKQLGAIDKADKPTAGQRLNQVKKDIQSAFDSATERLAGAKCSASFPVSYQDCFPDQATKASLAISTIASKPFGSTIAISESDLRSSST